MFFGTRLRILKENFADTAFRHRIERMYNSGAVPTAEDVSKTLISARRDLSEHATCPKWCKLQSLRSQISYTYPESHIPDVLLDAVAKSFFEDFPDGEIWHLEIDTEYVAKTFWGGRLS